MAMAPAFAKESGKSEFSHGAEVSSFVKCLVVLLYANAPALPPTKKKTPIPGPLASSSRYV
jgi:hypothetical protein